jgi:hypothetical protein
LAAPLPWYRNYAMGAMELLPKMKR